MVPGAAFFEMALAVLNSMVSDTSAPVGSLTAAAIAAPCILGSPAAQARSGSITSMLQCSVGSGSSTHTLEISSAPAGRNGKVTPHLTSSASAAIPQSSQHGRFRARMALSTSLTRTVSLGKRTTRQRATVATICPQQPCKGVRNSDGGGYTVHPAAADSSLHLGAVAGNNSTGPSRVPVGFGAYTARKAGEAFIHC